MTSFISITDIPHVIERIGLYLERKDQAACSLVSKAFRKDFGRLLWRDLAFQRIAPLSETNTDPDREKALVNNSHSTRRLFVDTQCRMGVISTLSESCTLLKDLNVFVSKKHEADMEETLVYPIIDIISRNKQLRTCSIIHYADLSTHTLGKLAGALSGSQCLTDLVIVSRVCTPPIGWLKCLLQNLPVTLKSLSLQLKKPRENGGSQMFPVQNWPESYPYLEHAKLAVEMSEREEHAFFQFLKRCPSLNSCTVPQMTTIQAITDFVTTLGSNRFPFTLTHLDCSKWTEMSDRQWAHLLWALKGSIQSFVSGVNFKVGPARSFVKDMIKEWSQTLESLNIHQPHGISSSDLQLILTSFPKLKSLNCICYWLLMTDQPREDQDGSLPGLKAMISDAEGAQNNDIVADWTCLEMEDLKLTFSDARTISEDEEVVTKERQWTEQGIKRVYQQIGRLTKLTHLTIGWCSRKVFSGDVNLDMSLQSGLEHMSELKSLVMLDVNYIPRINIGKPEAQWILANWPTLRRIAGFKYRNSMLEGSPQPSDLITLMHSERPWLFVS
ncbi:hypothetical protein B0O80DRAFT_495904 [Mortierella sp. GBAus27b]|nr:hypothetical protein BGX31_001972 [Mortierella sp. GBA43]KAI8358132.1 hypothetical protein B0O80DRAFT_495904 [Mortierella sp. GBAus27b]